MKIDLPNDYRQMLSMEQIHRIVDDGSSVTSEDFCILANQWFDAEQRCHHAYKDVIDIQIKYEGLFSARQKIERLRNALIGILKSYTDLVNSGDAGQWDCEGEAEVIAARDILQRTER